MKEWEPPGLYGSGGSLRWKTDAGERRAAGRAGNVCGGGAVIWMGRDLGRGGGEWGSTETIRQENWCFPDSESLEIRLCEPDFISLISRRLVPVPLPSKSMPLPRTRFPPHPQPAFPLLRVGTDGKTCPKGRCFLTGRIFRLVGVWIAGWWIFACEEKRRCWYVAE